MQLSSLSVLITIILFASNRPKVSGSSLKVSGRKRNLSNEGNQCTGCNTIGKITGNLSEISKTSDSASSKQHSPTGKEAVEQYGMSSLYIEEKDQELLRNLFDYINDSIKKIEQYKQKDGPKESSFSENETDIIKKLIEKASLELEKKKIDPYSRTKSSAYRCPNYFDIEPMMNLLEELNSPSHSSDVRVDSVRKAEEDMKTPEKEKKIQQELKNRYEMKKRTLRNIEQRRECWCIKPTCMDSSSLGSNASLIDQKVTPLKTNSSQCTLNTPERTPSFFSLFSFHFGTTRES